MDVEISNVAASEIRILSQRQWQALEAEHRATVVPWIDAYRDRRARRETHPVHDFLFTYYQTNRQNLKRWRPSADMILEGEAAEPFLSDDRYVRTKEGVRLNLQKLDEGALRRVRWVRSLISAVKARPARFNCFGLHEWAMVYRAEEIRHEKTPLRLKGEAIEKVVESVGIRCSHYDAFRFFTKEACPLNEIQPSRDARLENEQFGCVHFNMDLYKWCFKLSPWIGSDLLRECFLLALEARELDMRASPYDLREYGYAPILIETPEGREAYRVEQKQLTRKGKVLAGRLAEQCDYLLRVNREFD